MVRAENVAFYKKRKPAMYMNQTSNNECMVC